MILNNLHDWKEGLVELDTNVDYLNNIVEEVVKSYTQSLDDIMEEIHLRIIDEDDPDVRILEKYFLELSNCLYFMSERVEKLGIYDSISKLKYQEDYNNAYMNPELDKQKPTVAELTAYAEGRSIQSKAMNEIYSRAYKIIKNKIDASNTMISTLSKCVSRRMSDVQLTAMQPNIPNRKILNEEVII